MRARASMMTTERPDALRICAARSPDAPAPMIATSTVDGIEVTYPMRQENGNGKTAPSSYLAAAFTQRCFHRSTEIHHAAFAPWLFLYFFPLPQGQGSLRPTLSASLTIVFTGAA